MLIRNWKLAMKQNPMNFVIYLAASYIGTGEPKLDI